MTLQVSRVTATTAATPYGTLQVSSVAVTATTVVPVAVGTLQVASVKVTSQSLLAVPNAGPDQSVEPWATVTLTGTASGGTVASYNWSQAGGTAVTLAGSGASRTFTAPATMAGDTLLFGLTATDTNGVTSQADTVAVACLPATEFARSGGSWVPRRPVKRSGGAWA